MISSEEIDIKKDDRIERWLPLIINNEAFLYMISNFGRIYGVYRNKYIIPEKTKKGYLRVNIHWPNHKKHRKFFVHRLVGYLFVKGYSPELTINHKDGNHTNNYYKNLEWVSLDYNEHHATITKLHPSGDKHPNSTVTEEDVRKVCERLEKGVSCAETSRQTGVPLGIVYEIRNRYTWGDISKDYVWEVKKGSLEWRFRKQILELLKQGKYTHEILEELGYKGSGKMRGIINKIRIQYENDVNLTFNDYPYST